MFPTRCYFVEDSIAACACSLCQFTAPALIFVSLRCGDGVPAAAAFGAGGVRVHGTAAVGLVSLDGALYEFFRSYSRTELPSAGAGPS